MVRAADVVSLMIELRIEAPSLNRLRARFREAPRIVSEELRAAGDSVKQIITDEVLPRTPVGVRDPDEPARTHLRDTFFVERTGSGAFWSMRIGFTAPYALFVEEDTRPHVIRARRARALRFRVGGLVLFRRSVNHPGTRGQHMLRDGLAAAQPRIRHTFAARLGRVTRRLAGR